MKRKRIECAVMNIDAWEWRLANSISSMDAWTVEIHRVIYIIKLRRMEIDA